MGRPTCSVLTDPDLRGTAEAKVGPATRRISPTARQNSRVQGSLGRARQEMIQTSETMSVRW
ncbi:hypothetical protein C0Z11_09030 [Acidipropionibacterium jensenii]|nr:hypothetical protein C0Z11_09030 [Acidipropionibacterium jensenii]